MNIRPIFFRNVLGWEIGPQRTGWAGREVYVHGKCFKKRKLFCNFIHISASRPLLMLWSNTSDIVIIWHNHYFCIAMVIYLYIFITKWKGTSLREHECYFSLYFCGPEKGRLIFFGDVKSSLWVMTKQSHAVLSDGCIF